MRFKRIKDFFKNIKNFKNTYKDKLEKLRIYTTYMNSPYNEQVDEYINCLIDEGEFFKERFSGYYAIKTKNNLWLLWAYNKYYAWLDKGICIPLEENKEYSEDSLRIAFYTGKTITIWDQKRPSKETMFRMYKALIEKEVDDPNDPNVKTNSVKHIENI